MHRFSWLYVVLAGCSSAPPPPAPMPMGTKIPTDGVLPCDVQTVLQANCLTCHGTTTQNNAPISLVTFQDLVAKSPVDQSQTVAQRVVARLTDTQTPMPPAGGMAQTDIDTIQAWIAANYPSGPGGCDNADPFAVDPTCTKGTTWKLGNIGSSEMNPGKACIDCHDKMNGPFLSIGGTLYPTGHEPDLCNGGVSGALVVITDAHGKTYNIAPRTTSGNFYSTAQIAMPFTAKVTYQGRTRSMNTPQMSGDCNTCHTQDGLNGAPGRILLP